jgi:hypothetical protein
MVSTAPLRRAWSTGQVRLASHPAAYLPFARRRYGRNLAFGPDTEIVIEGFPRSANSFAVNAFLYAQGRDVRVAHHLHAAAQVIAAARARVPAVVLLRRPDDAIVSLLQWQPHLRPPHAVRQYLGFYEPLATWEERFVVATFGQVTEVFGEVIDRVNDRFGTSFAPFEHTEENVAACFGEIEEHSRRRRGGVLDEVVVARPSAARQAGKADVRARFERETPAELRDRLDAIHAHMERLAG